MKTVWVNRHNADGTFKPMSEWVLARVRSETTHVMFEDGRIFQGTRSDTFTSNGRSGIHEYIGNQRGDGWFDVEDEQPQKYVPVLVFRDPQNVKELTQDDVAIGVYWGDSEPSFGHTFALFEGGCWFLERCDTLLWQPIQLPKHID